MSYFTLFFDFGIVLMLATFFTDLLYFILCRSWKIRIEEVSIFFKIGAPVFKKEIGGITYILGWIPYGSYIKPSGMVEEDLEKVHVGDLPVTFLGKSKIRRTALYFLPYGLWIVVLLLCCLFVSPVEGFAKGWETICRFLVAIAKGVTGKMAEADLKAVLKTIVAGKSIIFLLLSWSMFINILFTPLSKAISWCMEEKRNRIIKTAGMLLSLFLLYLYIVKIMWFLFGIIGHAKIWPCVLGFSAGSYIIGTICFLLILVFAKVKYGRFFTSRHQK